MILVFFGSLEILHFDFLSGDGGATTWTKSMCNLPSLIYQWNLIDRLSVGKFAASKFFSHLQI